MDLKLHVLFSINHKNFLKTYMEFYIPKHAIIVDEIKYLLNSRQHMLPSSVYKNENIFLYTFLK